MGRRRKTTYELTGRPHLATFYKGHVLECVNYRGMTLIGVQNYVVILGIERIGGVLVELVAQYCSGRSRSFD